MAGRRARGGSFFAASSSSMSYASFNDEGEYGPGPFGGEDFDAIDQYGDCGQDDDCGCILDPHSGMLIMSPPCRNAGEVHQRCRACLAGRGPHTGVCYADARPSGPQSRGSRPRGQQQGAMQRGGARRRGGRASGQFMMATTSTVIMGAADMEEAGDYPPMGASGMGLSRASRPGMIQNRGYENEEVHPSDSASNVGDPWAIYGADRGVGGPRTMGGPRGPGMGMGGRRGGPAMSDRRMALQGREPVDDLGPMFEQGMVLGEEEDEYDDEVEEVVRDMPQYQGGRGPYGPPARYNRGPGGRMGGSVVSAANSARGSRLGGGPGRPALPPSEQRLIDYGGDADLERALVRSRREF